MTGAGSLADERRPGVRPPRFVWMFAVVMVATAGTAFAFKLYEFVHVARSQGSGALGSFLLPVLTYLIVAAGFLCLFLWAYASGQFRDVEAAKFRMLAMQDEIDAHERARRRRGLGHG